MLQKPKPKWWLLFALWPAMVLLLVIESQAVISLRGHQVLQLGILIFIFSLTALWVCVNASAMINEEQTPLKGKQFPDTVEDTRVDATSLPLAELDPLEPAARRFDYAPFKGRHN